LELDGIEINGNASEKIIHRTFSKENENREPIKATSIGPMSSNRSNFSAGNY